MAEELSVRRYRPTDAEDVWAVHERAFRASSLPFVEGAGIDEDLRRIRSEYIDPGGEFLVGCIERDSTDGSREHPRGGDERLVAVGGFVPVEEEAVEIRRMRVDPDHQRNGYGAAVLSSLEDAARERGYDRAMLETHALLAAAQSLYESRGYRETGHREGPDGHDRIQYEKAL